MKLLFLLLACPLFALSAAQTICIDPGHPSEVGVGTHGKHVTELHAAWEVSLKLRELLTQAGYHVVMTKSAENQFVTNIHRAETANDANAALAIRLHCDAGTKSGIATYYPGKQGEVNGKVGPSQTVIDGSHKLALVFHQVLIDHLKSDLPDRGLLTDESTYIGSKQGGALTGSIYSTVPVILVEMAVLQNPHDDLFISTDKGQEIVAKALAAGIEAAVPIK